MSAPDTRDMDNGGTGDDDRDAWLSEALRHAPDVDAAPPPALREAILAEARTAAARPAAAAAAASADSARPRHRTVAAVPVATTGWGDRMLAWWSALARPPVAAGFATVMVAVLVGVMWHDRPLDDATPRSLPPPAAVESAQAPTAEPATAGSGRVAAAPAATESARVPASPAATEAMRARATVAATQPGTVPDQTPLGAAKQEPAESRSSQMAAHKSTADEMKSSPGSEPGRAPQAFPAPAPAPAPAQTAPTTPPSPAFASPRPAPAPVSPPPAPAATKPDVAAASPVAPTPLPADRLEPAAPRVEQRSIDRSGETAEPTPRSALRRQRENELEKPQAQGDVSSNLGGPQAQQEAERNRSESQPRRDAPGNRAEEAVAGATIAKSTGDERPLAPLLAALADPEARWRRSTGSGSTTAVDADLLAWLSRLDATTAGRWQRRLSAEAGSDSASGSTSTIELQRDGRSAATIRIEPGGIALRSPAGGAWFAPLAPAMAGTLRSALPPAR